MAVVFLYWKSYLQNLKVWRKIAFAFFPTAALGFFFYSIIKEFLIGNTNITLMALFLGGFVLLFIDKLPIEKESGHDDIVELTDKQAMAIGVFQSISMIPGVSRAAASIIGGLVVGLKKKAAVEFSFLLAVPTMLAATSYDIYKSNFSFTNQEWIILLVGTMVSFFVAILAIKFFLKIIQTHSFAPFGIYRILLALLYFLIVV